MTFFARPNLSDEQFKQISGTTLTLSGQTRIANVEGFSISDGSTYIPIIVTGGTFNDVLTYKNGQIVLAEPTASGGTGVYTCLSPTTVTVGGLACNTAIYGRSITNILQSILVPLVYPTLVNPSSTFTITPSTSTYEVGKMITLTGCSIFNRGSITPAYCGGPAVRSSGVTNYCYTAFGGVPLSCASTSLSNTYVFPTNQIISIGNNSVSGLVKYCCGGQPLNSSGGSYCSPLAAGCTAAIQNTILGIYPWYYGSSATTPTINQVLINNSTSCVALSNGDITVTNYNVSGKYIWFAIPECACSNSVSSPKTKWQGSNSPSNCGTIPGDLFATECKISVYSPTGCGWITCYRVYVSNYPTSINYGMTYKNS